MCYAALLEVRCKRCLELGFGTLEEIHFEHCDPPCPVPYTIMQFPSDTTPERDHCEVCLPASSEASEGVDEDKVRIWRFGRIQQDDAPPCDWSEETEHLVTRAYCRRKPWQLRDAQTKQVLGGAQAGFAMEPIDPAEELVTVQEQINGLFTDLGKNFNGRPRMDYTSKEMEEQRELISPEIHWLRTCEETEKNWVLLRAEITTCARLSTVLEIHARNWTRARC